MPGVVDDVTGLHVLDVNVAQDMDGTLGKTEFGGEPGDSGGRGILVLELPGQGAQSGKIGFSARGVQAPRRWTTGVVNFSGQRAPGRPNRYPCMRSQCRASSVFRSPSVSTPSTMHLIPSCRVRATREPTMV